MKATILTAFGDLKMTKIHSSSGTKPYDLAKRFKVEVFDGDFFQLLKDLEHRKSSCLIRGTPFPSVNKHEAMRRMDSFDDQPIEWMMLDFDGQPKAHWPDLLKDTEEACLKIIPSELGECDFFWALGSSAGVKKDKYSIHLWVELEHAMTSDQIKPFTVERGFDGHLQHPIQIHYTASPIFLGMDDPVKVRSGVVRRNGKAKVGEIKVSSMAEKMRKEAERLKSVNLVVKKEFKGDLTTMEELIDHRYRHLITKSSRDGLLCDCPIHGSSSKLSLHIQPGQGKWYCHGCGRGGQGAYTLAFFLACDSKDIAVRHLKEAKT